MPSDAEVKVRMSSWRWIARAGCAAAVALPLVATGCKGGSDGSRFGGAGPADEARALMEQGRLDEALARLEGAPSEPEVIFVQGLIWTKKAEQAPPPEPAEEGREPPEFKLEERNALAFFETLTAAVPDHAGAHLAIAELLAPHALKRLETQRSRRRRAEPTPDPAQPDYSVERIVREIDAAIAADQTAAPADALIGFCTAVRDLDCAERGYRLLPERQPERAEPHRRLGDFLLEEREDVDAAIQQYDLALVWAPDDAPEDAEIRAKVAGLYLSRAEAQLGERRWAAADQAIKSARRYIASPGSPAAKRAAELEASLAQQSGRRF
jgi:tetratricopeptide (TPR) repeat protein